MNITIRLPKEDEHIFNDLLLYYGVSKSQIVRLCVLNHAASIKTEDESFKNRVNNTLKGLRLDAGMRRMKDEARRAHSITNALKTLRNMVVEGVSPMAIAKNAREYHKLFTENAEKHFLRDNSDNIKTLLDHGDVDEVMGWQRHVAEVKNMGLYKEMKNILVANKAGRENNLYIMREMAGVIKKIEKKE